MRRALPGSTSSTAPVMLPNVVAAS